MGNDSNTETIRETYRYGRTDDQTEAWINDCSHVRIYGQLTFLDVSLANRGRALRWHRDATSHWNGADWSNALGGEIGELVEAIMGLVAAGGNIGNYVKKVRRIEEGVANTKDDDANVARLITKIGHEVADVALYLDLVCAYLGIEIADVIKAKFNAVSEERGFPERL